MPQITDEDGEIVKYLTVSAWRALCLRLSMITHTSVEYYASLSFTELMQITDELHEQQKRIKAAAKQRKRR